MSNLLRVMPVFSPSPQSLNTVPQENSAGSVFISDPSEILHVEKYVLFVGLISQLSRQWWVF